MNRRSCLVWHSPRAGHLTDGLTAPARCPSLPFLSVPVASAQLRRRPGLLELGGQTLRQSLDGDPGLLERVPVAERDRVVLHRLSVDGDPPGRSDLILAAVAATD